MFEPAAFEIPTIEAGVELPRERNMTRNSFLLRLDVGESFTFPLADRSRWQCAASKHFDRKFTVRLLKGTDECRLWRVE